MINSQIKEYATVLLELDFDREQVVMIFDSLSKVLDNKEIYNFFDHPIINKDEKKSILKESLQLENSDLLYFLYVLVDNNKLIYIKDILEAYKSICDEKDNVMRFEVISTLALNENSKQNIKSILEDSYKKKINIEFTTDDKLIGGIVIKHNNEIIDDSNITLNSKAAIKSVNLDGEQINVGAIEINNLKQILLND